MPRPRDWTHTWRHDLVMGLIGIAVAVAGWGVYLAVLWLT